MTNDVIVCPNFPTIDKYPVVDISETIFVVENQYLVRKTI